MIPGDLVTSFQNDWTISLYSTLQPGQVNGSRLMWAKIGAPPSSIGMIVSSVNMNGGMYVYLVYPQGVGWHWSGRLKAA